MLFGAEGIAMSLKRAKASITGELQSPSLTKMKGGKKFSSNGQNALKRHKGDSGDFIFIWILRSL